jgi:hypothetical protein
VPDDLPAVAARIRALLDDDPASGAQVPPDQAHGPANGGNER